MISKIYKFISGILLIVCSLFAGFFCGPFYSERVGGTIATMESGLESLPIMFLLLTFGLAGFIGAIIRGISLLKSAFKPSRMNPWTAFTMDLLMVIAGILNYVLVFMSSVHILITITFFGTVILAIIDAIVLIKGLSGEGKGRLILGAISIVLIPALIINIAITIKAMIGNNLDAIAINSAVAGGFDSFSMQDLDGNEYTEDMFKGHKVTMVNLWGTFCTPCIGEMPELQEIYEEYDPSELQLVGLTVDLYISGQLDDNQIAAAKDIVNKTGVKYPILIPSQDIQNGVINTQIQAVPTTIFFNEKGEQIKVVMGASNKESWINIIEEVLKGEE